MSWKMNRRGGHATLELPKIMKSLEFTSTLSFDDFTMITLKLRR